MQIAPWVHVEPVAQLICVTDVQTPVTGLQQLPRIGCGQGFVGWQEAPCVQVVLEPVHWN
jgi:hypothetical protein